MNWKSIVLIEINPKNPQQRKIEQIVELLRNGGVIAYPTAAISITKRPSHVSIKSSSAPKTNRSASSART